MAVNMEQHWRSETCSLIPKLPRETYPVSLSPTRPAWVTTISNPCRVIGRCRRITVWEFIVMYRLYLGFALRSRTPFSYCNYCIFSLVFVYFVFVFCFSLLFCKSVSCFWSHVDKWIAFITLALMIMSQILLLFFLQPKIPHKTK